jgi:hypothetical protein
VHVAPLISRSLDEVSLAESLLGREHALVRALDRQAVALAQLLAVIALLAACGVAVAAGGRGALPVVIASAFATIGFGCRAALRALDRRERVRDVIIGGRGDLPLAVVERERRRLLDPRRREMLAHSYESIGDEPNASGRVPCRACVIVNLYVVAKVRPELKLIAALLRDEAPCVRGVAAAERMISTGTASLFGRDEEILREDLHRIAFLLRSGR